MIVLGLTGSIGMGKSLVARCFKRMGAAVFDADKEVHKLFAERGGEVREKVKKKFPEAVEQGEINRKKLGDIVFSDQKKLDLLEAIIHPKIREAEIAFIMNCNRQRRRLIVLDIPLLFESGAEQLCHYVVVVSANPIIQRIRVEKGRGVKKERYEKINQLQMENEEKVKRADFVIHTGLDKRYVVRQVKSIVRSLI